MSEVSVYKVAIQKSADGFNLISPEGFMREPVAVRTKLILQGKVQFLDLLGNGIAPTQALKALSAA